MAARRALDPLAYKRYQAARIVIDRSGPSAEAADTAPATTAEANVSNHPSNDITVKSAA